MGLAVVLATAVVALFYYLFTLLQLTDGQLGAPLDDAWIHLQFARNIAQGYGFSYNPGQPTPGSTAPLWTILLAVPALFTAEAEPLLRSALVLSAVGYLTAVGVAYGFAWDLSRKVWVALLAGWGTALVGRFVWAGLSGMEATLFAALSLTAVWLFTRVGLRWWVAVLFGLASQLRPEGHLLFAFALLITLIQVFLTPSRKGRLRTWRKGAKEQHESTIHHSLFTTQSDHLQFLWLPIVAYALISLPYVLFSLSTTGQPLPNTFYAKAGSDGAYGWRFLQDTLRLHFYDNPVALGLAILGWWSTFRKSPLTAVWLVGLPLIYAFTVDSVWHHGRYTMPLIPFVMVTAVLGAEWLAQKVPAPRVVQIGLPLLLVLGGLWQLPNWATMLGQNAKEIIDIDVALGVWLGENTAVGDIIAVDDIGAIAFFSGREIVDLNGLVSPELWPAIRQPERPRRNQELTRLLSLREHPPDYVASFPLWRWEIITNPVAAEELHHVRTETATITLQQDAYVHRLAWPYLPPSSTTPRNAEAQFGEGILLRGYELDGTTGQLTLFWESLAPVAVDYDLFVHVVNEAGEIVAQVDQQPVAGLAPTSVWQTGDVVRDVVVLGGVEPGTYTLKVGLYNRATAVRLPIGEGDVLALTTWVVE